MNVGQHANIQQILWCNIRIRRVIEMILLHVLGNGVLQVVSEEFYISIYVGIPSSCIHV